MQEPNSVLKIVNSKSGASLLFVLAVTLLLMAIGASALTAASANAGAGMNKQTLDQLNLYSDGIQKSIMYSLQTCGNDEGKNINGVTPLDTLGAQLMNIFYDDAYMDNLSKESDDDVKSYYYEGHRNITIRPELDGDASALSDVVISADSFVSVNKDRVEEEPRFDGDGEPIDPETVHYPREAAISATVKVTTETAHGGKSVKTVTTYRYVGGILTNREDADDEGPYDNGALFIENAGEWEFVSHEAADR